MNYGPKDENSGNNVYATVILKNLTWSGAVTVANVSIIKINSLINGHFSISDMDSKIYNCHMFLHKIMMYKLNQKIKMNFLNLILKIHLNHLLRKDKRDKKVKKVKNHNKIQRINDLLL